MLIFTKIHSYMQAPGRRHFNWNSYYQLILYRGCYSAANRRSRKISGFSCCILSLSLFTPWRQKRTHLLLPILRRASSNDDDDDNQLLQEETLCCTHTAVACLIHICNVVICELLDCIHLLWSLILMAKSIHSTNRQHFSYHHLHQKMLEFHN